MSHWRVWHRSNIPMVFFFTVCSGETWKRYIKCNENVYQIENNHERACWRKRQMTTTVTSRTIPLKIRKRSTEQIYECDFAIEHKKNQTNKKTKRSTFEFFIRLIWIWCRIVGGVWMCPMSIMFHSFQF